MFSISKRVLLAASMLSLLSLQPAHADSVDLKCTSDAYIEKSAYELVEIDIDADAMQVTYFSGKGSTLQTFEFITVSGDSVTGWGWTQHHRQMQYTVNRVTGFARSDSQVSDAEKPTLWNEKTNQVGYPVDEDVWMGYSLQCAVVKPLF
jgi:hypothetical protein